MSNMLEQAIVDAAALREAALKNAEQSIIEKYAPQIKEAVEAMLENEEKPAPRRMKHEGKFVNVLHEADDDGMMTVSEDGGKPYSVNATDLTEATDEEILQEEEAAMSSETTPTPEIEAPPAWDSRYGSDQSVTLTALLDSVDSDGNIEIDLGSLELSYDEMTMAEEAPDLSIDPLLAAPEEELDLGGEEGEESDLGGLFDDEELQLQEIVDAIQGVLEEEMEVDVSEDKQGWVTTDEARLKYEREKEEAKETHLLEEEEEEEKKKDDSKEKELKESILLLKQQNEKLENIVHKLNNKLEETLLSNAKLLYQNRTLNDASLNERQKSKIVEAIANAESPKEAKNLHETLRATVGTDKKKAPQSLNETVNRKSNLSSMLNSRQNINESKNSDNSFVKKMQKLAGIK